jgi:uncharacterized protein (TIGR00645 family)
MTHEITKQRVGFLKRIVRGIIFESKWILLIFYAGLILAQFFYCFKFCQEVWALAQHFRTLEESQIMLAVLTLIDIAMIANLLKMIVSGSYQTFIEKVEDSSEKVSSGILKVKMGGSLVGISSIHLLQAFMNVKEISDRELIAKASIHLIFLTSTIGLAYANYVSHKPQAETH